MIQSLHAPVSSPAPTTAPIGENILRDEKPTGAGRNWRQYRVTINEIHLDRELKLLPFLLVPSLYHDLLG